MPASMAAFLMMDMEAWDSPAGTVMHQRTSEGANLVEEGYKQSVRRHYCAGSTMCHALHGMVKCLWCDSHLAVALSAPFCLPNMMKFIQLLTK